MKRRTMLAVLGATSAGWLTLPARAARPYPSAPIRMVVPYSAGGGIDAVARMLAQGMSEELHQPVVVDNRGGAGGMLGAEAVAKAQPDGYTVLLAGNPELTITPQLQAKANYSAVTDFAPVVLVSQSPNILVASSSLGAKTLREALEAARKRPGGITVGTPGNGSPQHIAVEVLRMQTGLDIMHVPYKGAGPATVAVLGGEVSFALVGAPPVLPHISSGKLAAYAVTQQKRSPLVPDVPTVGESLGTMQNDDFVTWYGLLVPAHAPAEVVEALSKAAFSVLKRSDSRSRLAALGTDLVAMPAAAFAERMRQETRLYGEVIKRFGIKAT
ncbi:Tripartite-type tricarboxylate transporter, receptor component TctC [Variovorax sp. HW608]|uniref:Bug family tripartite tricarboxylate transporter substrate binding protein n=1 Tax=Variovorax sp. HW608 TaxID=1034889 RepID=UPI00081FA116|nr:tripartite tricarboxylate transporter substrate binding protein [Variovorax sp. HW608]SCK35197.1 Tripartite-type tricarboxylate transporter, receptor component TctC [Variovorax sp. HW608]